MPETISIKRYFKSTTKKNLIADLSSFFHLSNHTGCIRLKQIKSFVLFKVVHFKQTKMIYFTMWVINNSNNYLILNCLYLVTVRTSEKWKISE